MMKRNKIKGVKNMKQEATESKSEEAPKSHYLDEEPEGEDAWEEKE
jgi:hypothetical protein